jgi:metal-responsive CopG/Arc/MetJ family transcriptional regulator
MLNAESGKGREKGKGRGVYISVSFPKPLLMEVDKVVAELGYWPTRATFIREAIMQKLDRYKKEIETRKGMAKHLDKGRQIEHGQG